MTNSQSDAPLGAGQLDVGGGNGSPALFNAIARGIELKIVANKASMPPGYGYTAILVRKALYDSGKVRSVRDLRGLKIAESAPASNLLAYTLDKYGMTFNDVQPVVLGVPRAGAGIGKWLGRCDLRRRTLSHQGATKRDWRADHQRRSGRSEPHRRLDHVWRTVYENAARGSAQLHDRVYARDSPDSHNFRLSSCARPR